MGGDLFRLLDDLLAGHVDGHAADRQAAGAVGAEPEARSLAGVAVVQLDHFIRHAQLVGHDLGEGRVVTLAVAVRPHVHVYGAGRMESDL